MHAAGIGELSFRERFAGPMALGAPTPRLGAVRGRRDGDRMLAVLDVCVDDVAHCVDAADHRVRVQGYVSVAGVARRAPAVGDARLFVPDPEVGMKRHEYRLAFTDDRGRRVRLEATAFVRPGRSPRAEAGTLYVRVLADDAAATVLGAGVVRRCGWGRDRLIAGGTRALRGAWRRFVRGQGRTAVPAPAVMGGLQ